MNFFFEFKNADRNKTHRKNILFYLNEDFVLDKYIF